MESKSLITRTGNPGLNDKTFASLARPADGSERMTLQGTINKSFLMLVVLLAAAFWPWSQFAGGNAAAVGAPVLVGAIAGLVLALIISFKQTMAPYLALPYAACECLVLGGISVVLERKYPGVAIQAVAVSFGVMAAMLLAYTMRLIRVTQRMRSIVIVGLGAIMVLYLVSSVMSYFFHVDTSSLFGSSPLSIGISLVIIGFAAFSLLLDFDLIESGVAQGAPRYMEWYCAFALLVTLVWMYMEVLRLLSNLRQR